MSRESAYSSEPRASSLLSAYSSARLTTGGPRRSGGGLFVLNAGLSQYPAVEVVPVYQTFLILLATASAITFFHEMWDAPAWQYLLFATGVCASE